MATPSPTLSAAVAQVAQPEQLSPFEVSRSVIERCIAAAPDALELRFQQRELSGWLNSALAFGSIDGAQFTHLSQLLTTAGNERLLALTGRRPS